MASYGAIMFGAKAKYNYCPFPSFPIKSSVCRKQGDLALPKMGLKHIRHLNTRVEGSRPVMGKPLEFLGSHFLLLTLSHEPCFSLASLQP